MGQPKLIVAGVATVVLAIAAFVMVSPVMGVLVLVVGAGGTFLMLRQGGATLSRPRRGGDDDFLDADDAAPPSARADDGLPTWGSGTTEAEPLSTWQPTAEPEPLGTWEPTAEPEPLGSWAPEAEAEPEVLGDWEPAAETISLDEPVVDEAEEIALASSLVSTPINEDVASADDIMAASQATELHIEDEVAEESDGDNSELARLLAKVQERLAAYE